MSARLLADIIVLIHFAFILFVVFGGLLVLLYPKAAWAHLPAALWGMLIEVFGIVCPLTPLENRLRASEIASAYSGGFIDHYIIPLVYPPGLTREIQLVLAGLLLLGNGIIYWLAFRGRGNSRGITASPPRRRPG